MVNTAFRFKNIFQFDSIFLNKSISSIQHITAV